ncbi:hypothetical protein CLV59_10289 [Chitinophaga dinghuensis]|uniref:CAAX prenyl protease 2/Lysostaphin resistance protein A-like domain-containing protein n=1 Tax=Chitinophaga dinghuensis TaxID=1539050 RepID=A0A327W4G3_9BACT|nr:CPBP family intramembrane glutamic endopeptidase [Chitinophaga dinghuensis]RAJ85387.1 hypothetical protein CLV59_10289 [Chitinophaga dinghuensis]
MNISATIFSCLISLLPLLLILRRPDIKLSWLFLLHFVLLFTATEMALEWGGILQVRLAPEIRFNWLGKILGIVVSLAYYLLLLKRTVSTELVGLRWYVDMATLRGVMIAGILLVLAKSGGNYFSSTKEAVTFEGYLYQATLPGLQEELLYRGFLLALLQSALNRVSVKFLGLTLDLWIISILFALGHSFSITHHFAFHFNTGNFCYAFISGMVFGWIRVQSGSLVLPVVFHNFSNVMILVANAVK